MNSRVRYTGKHHDIKPQELKKGLCRLYFSSNGDNVAVPEPAGIPLLAVYISPYLPERHALSVKVISIFMPMTFIICAYVIFIRAKVGTR